MQVETEERLTLDCHQHYHSLTPSFQRQEGDQYAHVEDVKLQSYVNTMCPGEGESFYVGGKKGYLVKLAK